MKAWLIRALLALPGFAWFCRQVLDVQEERAAEAAAASTDALVAMRAGRTYLAGAGETSPMAALISAEALELYGERGRIVDIVVEYQHVFCVLEDGLRYPLPRATEAWQQAGAPLN